MLPACRTEGEGFAIPMFALESSDVEGFMDALQEFQSIFHDCFTRSEPRAHFFDYMVANAVSWNANRSNRWPSRSRGAASAGCSGLLVMRSGMRSRCGGTTIILLPTRWAILMGC